jgi:hypothetical protein
MSDQPGMRVTAVLKSDAERVWLLGSGVYEGDFPRPGWVESGERDSYAKIMEDGDDWPPPGKEREALLHQLSLNPRIRLDDGRVVWGFQCWWGPEEKFEGWLRGREVIPATA